MGVATSIPMLSACVSECVSKAVTKAGTSLMEPVMNIEVLVYFTLWRLHRSLRALIKVEGALNVNGYPIMSQ